MRDQAFTSLISALLAIVIVTTALFMQPMALLSSVIASDAHAMHDLANPVSCISSCLAAALPNMTAVPSAVISFETGVALAVLVAGLLSPTFGSSATSRLFKHRLSSQRIEHLSLQRKE